MEKGEDDLEGELRNLTLTDSYDVQTAGRLLQVEKAVDAAHATIMQQLTENYLLRTELQRKDEELKKYKSGYVNDHSPLPDNIWAEQENDLCAADQMVLHSENQIVGNGNVDTGPCLSDSVHESDLINRNENQEVQTPVANHVGSRVNGSLNMIFGHQTVADKTSVSHMSCAVSIAARYDVSNSEPEFRNPGMVLNATEVNNRVISKQDIIQKNQEQEMEILQLKNYLTKYSIKETKICNEKHALEKRISHMHLVFDQQQQDLSISASKANSYKQDIMEENVRLTYALQAAKEEKTKFVAFLIPLLAKCGLQPPVADAQSIVSNVKVLFRHLQEQCLATQEKLKESQYELTPWHHERKNLLELVPQPLYSDSKISNSHHMPIVEDAPGLSQTGEDDLDRNSPIASRNTASDNMFSPDPYLVPKDDGAGRKVAFGDTVSREVEEPENRRYQGDIEPLIRNTKHTSGALDDLNSYSPGLPTVLEEPTSSFSEAADDDPLPAIEGLQIIGTACPGQELQACGFSVNGTTSCNFEWVRHLEDGSFSYVDGAKKPTYLVTADDVDRYLAIEVQPLDNRKRKGDLVRVFANEHRKIACEPQMLSCIEKTLYSGHASFRILLSIGFLDLWEPATLAVKRYGYSIKCSGSNGGVVAKKFSASTSVSVSYESPTEFSIADSMGSEHIFRADNLTDISCSRDTIVLTLRLFILKAAEKKKGKKKFFSFNI